MADLYLSTLTSNGASVSATVTLGARLALQPDAPVYVSVGKTTATASATNGVYVGANQIYDLKLPEGMDAVAIISVSGTAVAKLFAVV